MNKIFKFTFSFLNRKGLLNFLSDKNYLKLMYWVKLDKKLNLNNPKTYNEKLQWLKLYNRNPIYTKLVDKYEVKELVAKEIGDQYIIPTLGVWDKFDEIDFDSLPNKFVLKCTHDSGGIVICKNKETFDFKAAKRKINKSLKTNYFYTGGREWPYKNVKPRIIAEEYMEDTVDKELRDYKFFCFDGKVKMLFIASNRQGKGDTYFDFYDDELNHLPFTNGHPNSPQDIKVPNTYDKMKKLAEILSKNMPHVKVDFYNVNGKIYFGEMTFYHWSGIVPFEPDEWDYKIGEWLKLPNMKDGE